MRPFLIGLIALSIALVCSAHAAAQPPSTANDDTNQAGPFKRSIIALANDVKELKSKPSLTMLMNGGILALLAVPVDPSITLGASSTRFLKAGFGTTGKLLGEEFVQAGGAALTYAVGHLLDKPRVTRVGADLVEAQFVSGAITQALKFSVQRRRPDGEARSFPSGHASASFASATVLHRHFGAKAAVPAYVVASYITMSRLQANSHYASDILIGAALGMVIGRAASLEVGGTNVQVAPAPVPGGAGLSITIR